jgi:uncharacterized protein (UPF0332 family)
MNSKNEDQIRALKEKARADLSDAELLLESGTAESTINRAYYAVFQDARAALQTEGESPDTHSGVIRRFGYYFVRTGRVSDEVGAILTSARSMRGEADYDAFSGLSREEAAGLVKRPAGSSRPLRSRFFPAGS